MYARQVAQIRDGGVIAILRGVGPESAVNVADAVVDGGVTALEVTADTPNVAETSDTLSNRFNGVLVGVGTVLDAETARAVQLAGAKFLVTPTVDSGVIETGNRYGTPVAIGAFTPTGALRAYEAGADFVKVFPVETGGPDHVAALGGPLPQIPLVPTGGVNRTTPASTWRQEPRQSASAARSLTTTPSRMRSMGLSLRVRAEQLIRSRPQGIDNSVVDQAIRDRNSQTPSVSRSVTRKTAPAPSPSFDRSPSASAVVT